ncbi:substrate-binding and VWA domain-containing protein [Planotetraspora sp. A-T 1434]|uniref:substrate-binding and VWA domain-containing protein n=1 Tax=Planotetraspora sp. A-T 1434 TaxID=2979219 RepID=UPI0021BEF734|nr:substrate-binding and VWA domain-containing protein [Planotetraspora sp. A-T 1434]MCT9928823.1 substrate-binding and VWA domain-containing protein [Planotetraspora sp. A-T 1434]
MPSGRHRAASTAELRRRRARWRSVVAGLTVLAVLGGLGYVFASRTGGTCSSRDPILVSVVSAVDIAPPVMEAAERFNARDAGVSGRCVRVQVVEQPPAPVLRTLIGDRAGVLPDRPDGWIADSSAWVRLARKQGAQDIAADETVVATSPLVFATRRAVAQRFAMGKTAMSWDMVFPATVHGRIQPTDGEPDIVRIPDPSVSGAGIATVAAARDIVGSGETADKDLTAFVRMAQAGSAPDYRSMLEAVDQPGIWTRPVVIVPEQSVWAHNRDIPADPLTALQPKEGTINLDYPYVVTAADPDQAAGSRLFGDWLRSAFVQEAVRHDGFRTADGREPPYSAGTDIPTEQPRPRPSITPEVIDEALEAWSRLAPPSRILVLADVSKENAEPIRAGGKTRMDVAVEAAKLGLQLFPNETHIGLWEFARDVADGENERELVSLGPITEPGSGQEIRRTALYRVADGIKARGDKTSSLYDSINEGFQSVSQGYDPLMSNSLLLLTAGRDDGKGISRQQLVERLHKEWNPDKPVQIIIVAFGKGADQQALNEIVSATNGQLYVAQEPGQIIDVFLSALARRLCHPTCRPSSS